MGLKEDVESIKKLLEEQKEKPEEKKFRLPKRVGRLKAKKNWVTVITINENSVLNFQKVQIEDQTIMVDTIPRLASAGYVMYWKKYPVIILPSWSVEPFSPLQHYQVSLENGQNVVGYKILMAKMLSNQTETKKKIGKILPWIIGVGALGVIGYAFLSGGGT